MTGTYRYDTEKNRKTIAVLHEALKNGPMCIGALCRRLDLTHAYVWRLVHQRIDFHIAHYERTQTCYVAQWAAGPGKDAEQPVWVKEPKPPKVKPEPRSLSLARERSYGFVKQPVARDWAVAMMFGPGVNLNAELRGMHA